MNHPSPKLLVVVYVLLMLLLAATLLAGRLQIGHWHVVLALTIAGVKALLILVYFMHLRYSQPLTWLVAGAGFFWFAILIDLTLSDYLTRGPNWYAPAAVQRDFSDEAPRAAGSSHQSAKKLPAER